MMAMTFKIQFQTYTILEVIHKVTCLDFFCGIHETDEDGITVDMHTRTDTHTHTYYI